MFCRPGSICSGVAVVQVGGEVNVVLLNFLRELWPDEFCTHILSVCDQSDQLTVDKSVAMGQFPWLSVEQLRSPKDGNRSAGADSSRSSHLVQS